MKAKRLEQLLIVENLDIENPIDEIDIRDKCCQCSICGEDENETLRLWHWNEAGTPCSVNICRNCWMEIASILEDSEMEEIK